MRGREIVATEVETRATAQQGFGEVTPGLPEAQVPSAKEQYMSHTLSKA